MKKNYSVFYKRYYCLLSLAFLFCTNTSIAQKDYSNSIKLSFTNLTFPGLQENKLFDIRSNFFDQLGVYYERKLGTNWRITIGYAAWNNFFAQDGYIPGVGPLLSGTKGPLEIGDMQWRHSYKMIDLFLFYRLNIAPKHKINIGIGPSYYWGTNVYIDSYKSGTIYLSDHKGNYWGVVPAISYDFLCLGNRLNIGADVRCRKYFGLISEQVDYGIHIGFNF